MTLLARTPPALWRLFDIVDMAPQPHEAAVAQGLSAWTERRGDRLAPKASDMAEDETTAVREHSFEAEPLAGGSDFALSRMSETTRMRLGLNGADGRLSRMTNRRLAVRLRRLLRTALDYGEPVMVRFVDEAGHAVIANFELLAAPVALSSIRTGLFCTLACRPAPAYLRPHPGRARRLMAPLRGE